MSRKSWIVLTTVLLFGGALYAFDLVKDTQTASIVLPENPHPSSRLAAEELSEYVCKVTGKKLAVAIGQSDATNKVYIGTFDTLNEIPESAAKALKAAKQDEAHFICAKGNNLYIIGKQEVAELYATYQFIEDKLGVRWLKVPDEIDNGEYVPKSASIVFDDYERFREPAFAVHRIDRGHSSEAVTFKGKTWANRNGYQTPRSYERSIPYDKPDSPQCSFFVPRVPRSKNSIGGSHTTFVSPMPAKTTFDEHPEYFALIDGKRVKGNQYCISNPEVRRNVADFIIRGLDKGNGLGMYNFGMWDTGIGWCECEECRKLDGSDTTANGLQNVSTRFFKTVCAIAEMVYQKSPEADLRVWAYNNYRELPDGVTLPPKMKLQFCDHGRCYGHTLDAPNCPRNARILKLLKGWLKLAPNRVFTYEYLPVSHAYYACSELVQAHDLRLYRELGLIGYKEEGMFPDSKFYPPKKDDDRGDWMPSNWQWAYVTAKLLWDPSLDEQKLLDEAEALYYGKAYPVMKQYHAMRRRLWSNTPQCMGYPYGDGRGPFVLNSPGSAESLLAFLDKADKLAEGDSILQYRLANDRRFLKEYWIKPNSIKNAPSWKTLRAPSAQSAIVIDGDGNDSAWISAFYLSKGLKNISGEKRELPDALKTTLGILSDNDNLYFLITALEPSPEKMKTDSKPDGDVWKDDGIELFLYPPTAANVYYHLIINAKGTVFDAQGVNPPEEFSIPVEVKTRILKDRYVIEARLPLEKLKRPERGEIWRMNFTRNRQVDDDLTPAKGHYSGLFSLDGCGYHDVPAFRPLELGTPHLRNGSFEELDDNGNPKHWELKNRAVLIESQGNHALKMQNSYAFQLLAYGELGQKPFERKISYSLRASGSGVLKVCFLRYTDTTDPKAKNGYRRTHHKELAKGGEYQLTDTQQIFSGEYTIAPNEWIGLELIAADALIDDVSVLLVK